jgi:hypothetical protein
MHHQFQRNLSVLDTDCIFVFLVVLTIIATVSRNSINRLRSKINQLKARLRAEPRGLKDDQLPKGED